MSYVIPNVTEGKVFLIFKEMKICLTPKRRSEDEKGKKEANINKKILIYTSPHCPVLMIHSWRGNLEGQGERKGSPIALCLKVNRGDNSCLGRSEKEVDQGRFSIKFISTTAWKVFLLHLRPAIETPALKFWEILGQIKRRKFSWMEQQLKLFPTQLNIIAATQ